jgi:predicted TIM-barrel fold metal-dependent hydrolase
MIIDFHTHIFPPGVKKHRERYIESDPCFATLYADKKAVLADADDLVRNMDREGIDVSVALNIGWATHDLCVETNDYIMEAVAKYPDRLIGFGAVQPRAFDAAWREMERCAAGGLKGIGELRPDIQMLDFNDTEVMDPFFETVNRLGFIVLTHASEPVGHNYPGKGAVTPEILYPLLAAYPETKLVLAHWGGGLPFYALMPEVGKALENVWYDSAASPYLYRKEIYVRVSELVGAEKVLFGSDYPLLSQKRVADEVRALALAPETEEAFLGGNARKLLGIR